jgi:DNA (cytosine-5)-methyltransferase 1
LVDEVRPRWLVWENVPGVLSSNGGRDFSAFTGALAELGYGFAFRVLDAQFFGVPQRRRRVFLVGHFGDWRPAGAVLFEPESLPGHSQATGKTRKKSIGRLEVGVRESSNGQSFRIANCLTRRMSKGMNSNLSEGQTPILSPKGIRRLTPTECERLQGFPDGHTAIEFNGKPSKDSPRYRALGNSMAVPVMAWIGRRLLAAC